MANTDTIQAESNQENATVAETMPKAPPTTPTPKDEGDLRLVKKVAQAFQMVVAWAESQAEARYHVVIERSCRPAETIECATEQELRECIGKLCAEVYEYRQKRENADAQVYVFHGVRYHLQKWPYSALVHGKDVIPLDPLEDLTPVIDVSGSLLDPPCLADRGPARTVRPQPLAGEGSAGSGRAVVSPAGPLLNDGSTEEEEGLPPGQDPQVIG